MYLQNGFQEILRRKKRKRNKTILKIILIIISCILVGGTVFAIINYSKKNKGKKATASESLPATVTDAESKEETDTKNEDFEEEFSKVLAEYKDLGIVKIEDSALRLREEPAINTVIKGTLYNGAAVDILDSKGSEWLHVKTGGVEGWVDARYVAVDDEAKALAREYVKKRAIILKDEVRLRATPEKAEGNIVDILYTGDRYEVVSEGDEWVELRRGYVAKELVMIKLALDEAHDLTDESLVIRKYNNLGISTVTNYLNVRSEPSTKKGNENIIGKMPSNAAGEILETVENEGQSWYKIKSGKVTGYVSSEFILTGDEAKNKAKEVAILMATIIDNDVNVRSEKTIESKSWTKLSNAEKYEVISQDDNWVEIEFEAENRGYVSKQYVKVRYELNEAIKFTAIEKEKARIGSRRTQIVEYSMQFLGNPYVWGGTSLTRGCDCSGFTMQILKKFGVSLPHYSVAQSKLGKKIDSSSMRPGDLIFYANKSGTINHVSLYIGNGQVIHAASRRSGIKISTWNYRRPVAIRNVLGD